MADVSAKATVAKCPECGCGLYCTSCDIIVFQDADGKLTVQHWTPDELAEAQAQATLYDDLFDLPDGD